MDSSKRKKPGKVRIADHLRKRALVSCDRCKKRRVRCSRVGEDPCENCVEARVECKSTLPRKTRIYGSVETLSMRYRVLDALVKGLLPNKDTNEIDVLYEIAAEHKITLPEFTEENLAAGDTRMEEIFAQVPKELASSPAYSEGSQRALKEEPTPTEKSATLPSSPQETLVPTPSGDNHILLDLLQNDPSMKLMINFATSKWSKGLEPKAAEEKHTAPGPADLERDPQVSRSRHVLPLVPGKDPSEKEPLSSLLPAREIADVLVQSFFDHVHPDFMLFRRRSFEQRYESMWSQLGNQVQDFEAGWLCSVLMVLVLGAQTIDPQDDLYLQMIHNYKVWVQSRVSQLQYTSTLVNIQALLLLHMYLHNMSERNAAWTMLGAVLRMAMTLGMHREGGNRNLDAGEIEVRRRVWWTIYVLEQNSCTILGRPCSIDDMEVTVKYPNEDLLDGSAHVPMGYVEELCRLTRIMARTSKMMYPSNVILSPGDEKHRIIWADRLLAESDEWRERLPPHLRLGLQGIPRAHSRAIYLLHLQFHLVQSLVTRPYAVRKAMLQVARKKGKHVSANHLGEQEHKLSSKCGLSSKEALKLIYHLITLNQFNGVTWTDPYYVYHSVAVIALEFLAKDEPDNDEEISRRKAVFDVRNAMDNIRLCPVFAMLTQVSFQFAQIVGIIDNHVTAAQSQHYDAMQMQSHVQAIPDIDIEFENPQQSNIDNVFDLILGNNFSIPWKVGPDAFTHSPQVSAPMMDSYMDRSMPAINEQVTATALQGMQPQQPYVSWPTGGYGVIPTHAQYGNPSATPSHINSNSNGNGQSHAQYSNTIAAPSQFPIAAPNHANGNGNGNGPSHAQYANPPNPPHLHSNGNGHPHAQYSNSHPNYEHRRN
ncbi:C6 transcription factor [Botrytis cinerea]